MEAVKQDSKIYVACLASYNAGCLSGKWITPADTEEKLQAQIDAILKASPEPDAEEWAIHDYNNFPNLGEYPSVENIIKVVEAQKKHGVNQINAFLEGHSIEDLEHFEDSYSGEFDNFREYSDQLFDELYLHDVPEHILIMMLLNVIVILIVRKQMHQITKYIFLEVFN